MDAASDQDGIKASRGFGARTKIAVALVSGFFAYTLAGFFGVPLLVEREIGAVPLPADQRISVNAITFNPFTFRLKLRELSLVDSSTAPSATAILSATQIIAHARLTSLIRGSWIFYNLTIDAPYAEVSRANLSGNGFGNGSGNRSADPLPMLTSFLTWAFSESADLNGARVGELVVHGGQLKVAAATSASATTRAAIEVAQIELGVHNQDPSSPIGFSLTASLNNASGISSKGHFALAPASLEASLSIPSLDTALLLSVLALELNSDQEPGFDAVSGQSSVDGTITYAQGTTQFHGTLQSTDIAVAQTSDAEPVFTAELMLATMVVITHPKTAVMVGKLNLKNPHLTVQRNADGTLADGTLSVPSWLVTAARGSDPGLKVQQIQATGGSLDFRDVSSTPPVLIVASEVEASMSHAEAGIEISISARINESGQGHLSATCQPVAEGFKTLASWRLNGFELSAVSPWFQRVFTREITSGFLTMETGYESTGSDFKADNHLVVDALVLADAGIKTKAAVTQLDLAIALLEDERGRMDFTLPLASESAAVDEVLSTALRDFVDRLVLAPLTALAGTIGAEPGVDRIGFVAGNAAFTPAGERKLASLGQALQKRPRLGARLIPRYHPNIDEQGLARQQVLLHIALATSAGPPGSAARTTLVLGDPKVISVLDEFASARLPINVRTALGARFPTRDETYYRAVLDALIDNEKVSSSALERIARFRARAIVDALAATGVTTQQLVIGDTIETARSEEQVTSRMELFAVPGLSADADAPVQSVP